MDTQERFLQRKDYGTIIKEAYLRQIIDEDDAVLLLAEDAAIEEMKPYLARYDTRALFAPQNRHPLLVIFCTDIALYHLMASVAQPRYSEGQQGLRVQRYQRAIAWLDQVRKGEISLAGFPPLAPTQTTSQGNIHITSNPKRQHHF